jgi:hypothetical protein
VSLPLSISTESALFRQVFQEVTHLVKVNEGSVVFNVPDTKNRYTQLSCMDDSLSAESVSNDYLEGAEQLSAAQNDLLITLGWNAPDVRHAGNFWRDWNAPFPLEEIAALLTKTLMMIHNAPASGVTVVRI